MFFRFMETTRPFASFSDVPVSKNGNKFLSFRAKQVREDGTLSAESTLTVWGDDLCNEVLRLQFGDVVDIEGQVKEFSSISSITKGEVL